MDSRTGCLVPTGRDSNGWVVCVVGVGDGDVGRRTQSRDLR